MPDAATESEVVLVDEVPEPESQIPEHVDHEAEKKKKMGWVEYTWVRCQEMGIVKTIAWIFATMMYQCIGAWMYIAIEGEYDHLQRLKRWHAKSDLLLNRTDWLEQTIDAIIDIQNQTVMFRELMIEYESNMQLDLNPPLMKPEGWSWLNSIFFCCSLYTCIGFGGRLFPQSNLGRVVTMVYSILTQPIFFRLVADFGLFLFECCYTIWFNFMEYKRAREEPEFDDDQIRGFRTKEYRDLYTKIISTFPFGLGIIMSVLSLLLSSALVQFFEPTWSFFDANYYFVTSFLMIGLGDVSPSAPENGPEWTLIPHIILLAFSMTCIGLCAHVLSRRVELAHVHINYAIHMEFRTRQVEPDISTMKSGKGPVAEEAQIALIARKLGSFESLLYGVYMDRSRRKLLLDAWHTKANMECVEVQTNLPKREIGIQHLMNVEEKDVYCYGDDLGEEPRPPPPLPNPDMRAYVYKVF